MTIKNKYISLLEAVLCSFSLMVFSFFIQYEFPFRLIAFAALFVPASIFSRNLKSLSDLKSTINESTSPGIIFLYCIAGTFLGILLSILYRWHLDISLFPDSLHIFCFMAALIGCTEELVFRGFIQDYVKRINPLVSIIFSTISHTGYKCCLFLSPVVLVNINIEFLAFWTIIAGILSGAIKHFSKSLLPSLISHALFDILVYAEHITAPWWVW